MKKILSIAIPSIIVLLAIFTLKKYYYNQTIDTNLTPKNSDLICKTKYKGLKNAIDFAVNDKGDYYIAYGNKIQFIKNSGQSYDIIKDGTLNVSSLECFEDKLFITSDTKIYCYDLWNKKLTDVIKDLPNYGDYKKSLIKIKGDYMYISVGAATNSGVVGMDNNWMKDNPYFHDITPKDITLKGLDFGNEKTGAFQSYKTKSIKGQIVAEHFPGNASILIYNLKTGNRETYAWGIRNITGMDFTNEGKLIAAVGGMENRGSRPIKGDSDYLYEIKKNVWYGWPDYSGGDPVTSPRFKGVGTSLQFILENHPTTNPPAPMLQYNNVSSIYTLAVDSNGVLGEKNKILFYDKSKNILFSYNGSGAVKEEVKFGENTEISALKFSGKSLLVLDEASGYIYSIEKGQKNDGLNLGKEFYGYLMGITLIGILLTLKSTRGSN